MSKFQIGDVIEIASGGLSRTVSAIYEDDRIGITWENNDGSQSHEEVDGRLYRKKN